ncbi:MAG: oligopeptide transporter, OPT family [Coriobacteriaceae bacterium]|nr:oligopeptide transporter, OPT family [Coriobacteriaceae bacterium]
MITDFNNSAPLFRYSDVKDKAAQVKPSQDNQTQGNGEKFKPYVSPDENMREFSVRALLIGCVLAMLFGAANAYLAMKVGMTICASIPAAVIGMVVLKRLRNSTILENNIVQTVGSSGEALAAGVAFTVPALLIMNLDTSAVSIFAIAMTGGLLGCLLMIPLRKRLVQEEHGKLPYPEGTACAEMLMADQEGSEISKTLFKGLAIGAGFKFLTSALRLIPEELDISLTGYLKGGAVGADFYPSLLGAGFLVGPKISGMALSGSVIGWLVVLPLICMVGQYAPEAIGNAAVPISEMDHWDLWSDYLRYVGIGAVIVGGFISLIKAIPTIVKSIRGALGSFRGDEQQAKRTDQNVPVRLSMIMVIVLLGLIAFQPLFPNVAAGSVGAVLVLLFGFVFVTVSAHMVGYVGSSNNPIVAMSIGALLVTALLFRAVGFSGTSGVVSVVVIGAVICICIGVSGDMAQDLKTGFLLGATPSKQQYGQMIGVICSAAVMGWIIIMLNDVYVIGSKDLPAPQANMIMSLAQGVMEGELPWTLILVGGAIALAVWLLGGEVLPFAVGLYLPIHLSVTMMVGGIIRWIVDRKNFSKETRSKKNEKGTLLASGYIAGDALMSVLATALVYFGTGIDTWAVLDPLRTENAWISALVFCLVVAFFVWQLFSSKDEEHLSGREINL